MAVPRAKKKKKPEVHRPSKTPFEIVKTANYVLVCAVVRTLWMEYGWRHKRIMYFLECILSLVNEASRFGYERMLLDTAGLTGIDVLKLVDEALEVRPKK